MSVHAPDNSPRVAARVASDSPQTVTKPLLEIRNVHTWLTGAGNDPIQAVDGVSLSLGRGQSLGVVGESGSGKSMLARTIMGLLPENAHTSGTVHLGGVSVLDASPEELRSLWSGSVSIVFQDAGRALNPVVRVGRQVVEAVQKSTDLAKRAAHERAIELFREVRIPDPERVLRAYPHQLSGGMRQRAMIAVALSSEPDLLIADEPTTALDVTVQRQILDLLTRIRTDREMALILISHDLGLIAGQTERAAVMYAGRLVESGPTQQVFSAARHRYTRALIEATPSLYAPRGKPLASIEGSLPDPTKPEPGCRFLPRCGAKSAECELPAITLHADLASVHEHNCLHPAEAP